MIAHNSEEFKMPEKFFGHKLENPSFKLANGLILLACLLIIFLILPWTRELLPVIVGDRVLAGLIVGSVAVMMVFAAMEIIEFCSEFPKVEFRKKFNASYYQWYCEELIPFLSRKYALEFDLKPILIYPNTVFGSKGELAKTQEGKIIRVAIGGLEWVSTPVSSPDNKLAMSHNWLRYTLNGNIWLTKVSEAETL